jgi:hypothetical protein
MKHTLELNTDELQMLFAHVDGTYSKSGRESDILLHKNLRSKLKKLLSAKKPGISSNSIEFYSNTYNGQKDICFVFGESDDSSNHIEQFVDNLLEVNVKDRWERISEFTYRFHLPFSMNNFNNAKNELIDLGFAYKGPIDEDAMD